VRVSKKRKEKRETQKRRKKGCQNSKKGRIKKGREYEQETEKLENCLIKHCVTKLNKNVKRDREGKGRGEEKEIEREIGKGARKKARRKKKEIVKERKRQKWKVPNKAW
jgi:hypothetical protein